ncbi:MAG: lipoprotein [Sulfuritalea sp.]|nr:lipoprotein [Sulfuritalea sp.]
MRLIQPFLAALVALTTLAACGTKTPLTLPPPELPAVKAAVTCPQSGIPCTQSAPMPTPAADNTNKATEPRQ